MIEFVMPTTDASTFVGQLRWFMYGFGYSSVIASVAFMIRLVKSLGKDTPDL